MRETSSKMHMNDMVKIDTIVFEIVCGGGGSFQRPSPDRYNRLKYPG